MERIYKIFQSILEKLREYLPDDKKYMIDILSEDSLEYLDQEPFKDVPSYKEFALIPLTHAETIKYAFEKTDFKHNSIFVTTFPKTGTTWTIQMVREMLYGKDEMLDKITRLLNPRLNYLEMGPAIKHEVMLNLPTPRVLYGTHLPEELVNVEKITKRNGKFIIVMRNPKDQAVSLYHFMQQSNFAKVRDRVPSDWPGFFEKFVAGKIPLMSRDGEWYPEHVLGWYKHKNDDNFLFLYYEDMKKDCIKELRRISRFLDLNLTEDRLKEIKELTSFQAMKKRILDKNSEDGCTKLLSNISMLRSGKVGDWKDVFTVNQSELMDKMIEEKLGHTDIKFTYEL